MKTQEIQKITDAHICAHLTAFIEQMDRDDIATINEHGGFIWFKWQGVNPEDIELNLVLGSADDRARREFLDSGNGYIAYDGDQDLWRDEDGNLLMPPVDRADEDEEPRAQDDDYIEKTRVMWIKCADMRAHEAWNEIQDRMAHDGN